MTLAAIAAGKPVLCEKPIALDAEASAKVVDAARKKGVFLMEGYMYRGHPLMREVVKRLQEGVIGKIRHVRADFAFRVPRDPEGRLFATSLGGGGILDVGGYVTSFARLIAGIAEGVPFAEPTAFAANGVIGPHGADETATALLTFKSGVTATVTAAVFHDAGTTGVVFGDEGKIVMPDPWIPQSKRQCLETSYTIHRDGKEPETVAIKTEMPTYAIEAELVADTLPALEPAWPAMTLGGHAGQHACARRVESRARLDSEVIEKSPEVIEKLPSGNTGAKETMKTTMIMRRGVLVAFAAIATIGFGSCKKSGESGSGAAPAAGGGAKQYKFAFVTNNSAGFWNIARKGVEKAEQDLGIKAEVLRPLKGELAEQQRYLEDVMVRDFDGMAVSPVNPESMTPLLDRVAAKMPVICHDSDAPKSKRVSYVGTNNTEAGRAAGQAALKALGDKKKGKVALFVGRIDMQNAIERRAGVEEMLKAVPASRSCPCSWTAPTAPRRRRTWRTRWPAIPTSS